MTTPRPSASQAPPSERGRFITFEGLDGSGKSTHLERAAAWLEGRGLAVRLTHEPGGTPLCDAIRAVFLDPRWKGMDGRVELLLVFASRRQHLLEVIEPALSVGEHVLCDRFTDSTLAYQGGGRGVERNLIEAVDQLATGGLKPDHTLLFELSVEEACARGQSPSRRQRGDVDRLDVEEADYYRRVERTYQELARAEPRRFCSIDASGSREETWAQVESTLRGLLPELASAEAANRGREVL